MTHFGGFRPGQSTAPTKTYKASIHPGCSAGVDVDHRDWQAATMNTQKSHHGLRGFRPGEKYSLDIYQIGYSETVWPSPGRLSALSFSHSNSLLSMQLWRFCMGAQGA
jgi:hypothetical protein